MNNINEFRQMLEDNGAEMIFGENEIDGNVGNESQDWSVVEDDGALNISRFGISGVFICNQEISRSEWNRESNRIMSAMNVPQELRVNGRQ